MIKELALSAAIVLSSGPSKYRSSLKHLQNRLAREGYDISSYLEDSRFEIYEPVKRLKGKPRYINYADTTQSWYMKRDSIESCADFVEEYRHWLEKAGKEFGPSPEHITSLLELETNRGNYTGKRPIINSLISVYINVPRRREEFYRYLKGHLNLQQDTTDRIIYPVDMLSVKGSWLGARGIAQGMPDKIKKYGKDFDGDGFFDPMNMADAIGFAARQLADNGFDKDPLGATQKYNRGHPFYGSSIGKHTRELKKVMDKREKEFFSNIEPLSPISSPIGVSPMKNIPLKKMNFHSQPIHNRKRRLFSRKIPGRQN